MKIEQYQFIEKIGGGTHGNTYLLANNNHRPYFLVCKSVLQKNIKYAENEIGILRSLSSKRIVKYYDSMTNKNNKYIVMEHANYGDLEKLNSYLKTTEYSVERKIVWSIFAQLVEALAYLQKHRIIHRDIKPGNILLNRIKTGTKSIIQVKLCDFSLSKRLDENKTSHHDKMIVGTPYYMSPEILLKEPYDYSVDVWSLGVVMYELITKERPFESESKRDLRQQIIFKEFEDIDNCKDYNLKKLVLSCLEKQNRVTAKELKKEKRIKLGLTMNKHELKQFKLEKLEKKIYKMSKEKSLKEKIY